MNDQPDLSTLPQRMRYAARVIEEARKERARRRGDGQVSWPVSDFVPQDLRKIADEFEAEDREAAERADLVEELAQAFTADDLSGLAAWMQETYRRSARRAIESGWRKADPA